MQPGASPDLQSTPPVDAGGEPGTRFDGAKDTPMLSAQPLHNRQVQNRGNLLQVNTQGQTASLDLPVPKKLFCNLQASSKHGPEVTLTTLKCTSSTLPLAR